MQIELTDGEVAKLQDLLSWKIRSSGGKAFDLANQSKSKKCTDMMREALLRESESMKEEAEAYRQILRKLRQE